MEGYTKIPNGIIRCGSLLSPAEFRGEVSKIVENNGKR